jgi:hypothetical protein
MFINFVSEIVLITNTSSEKSLMETFAPIGELITAEFAAVGHVCVSRT